MRFFQIAFCIGFLMGTASAMAEGAPDAMDLEVCAFLATTAPPDLSNYTVDYAVADVDGDGSLESFWIRYGGTAEVPYPQIGRADGSDADLSYSPAFLSDSGHDDFRID